MTNKTLLQSARDALALTLEDWDCGYQFDGCHPTVTGARATLTRLDAELAKVAGPVKGKAQLIEILDRAMHEIPAVPMIEYNRHLADRIEEAGLITPHLPWLDVLDTTETRGKFISVLLNLKPTVEGAREATGELMAILAAIRAQLPEVVLKC